MGSECQKILSTRFVVTSLRYANRVGARTSDVWAADGISFENWLSDEFSWRY